VSAAAEPVDVDVDDLDVTPPVLCRVPGCAVALPDRRYSYCDAHRHLSQHKGARKTRAAGPGAAEPIDTSWQIKPPVSKAAPSGRKSSATGTVAKLLVIATLIWMRASVARRGFPDHDGKIAETLSLSADESVTIARPLARMIDTSTTASRVLGPVVRNEDVLAAAMALIDWQHRVKVTLDQIARHGPGNVAPAAPRARPVSAEAAAAGAVADDGPDLSAYRATPEPFSFNGNGQFPQPY
jgi:hypothetical protein